MVGDTEGTMTEGTTEAAIILVKTLVLVFGLLITYQSLKAYRRTNSRPLRDLALGFGIVTTGAALGGVANQVFSVAFTTGILIQSSLTALGFAVITFALYAD